MLKFWVPVTLNKSPADPEHSLLEEVFKGVLDFCYEKDKMEKARSTRGAKVYTGSIITLVCK